MATRVGRPRTFNKQSVTRLAEKGVELEAIVAELGIPAPVVKAKRAELKEIVAKGNQRFKVALASRLFREGVGKGKSHALLALARKHLGFDRPQNDGSQEERFRVLIDGATSNLGKMLDKLESRLGDEREG
jgi:hypothetical protein